MPKNIADLIIEWPYHVHTVITLGYIGFFFALLPGDGSIWDALLATTLGGPIVAILLLVPYFLCVFVLALLLSIFKAIQSMLHRPT